MKVTYNLFLQHFQNNNGMKIRKGMIKFLKICRPLYSIVVQLVSFSMFCYLHVFCQVIYKTYTLVRLIRFLPVLNLTLGTNELSVH